VDRATLRKFSATGWISEMNDFVAHTSRFRMAILVIVSLAFVAGGVWMTGLLGPPPVSSRSSPEMVMALGWITIAFFGLGAVVIARLWWANNEMLRINPRGIRWLRWCDQTIPWDQITDITEWRYKSTRSIILHVRDPQLYPGKGIVGWAGRANRTLTGGDIGISMLGTDRTFDEAMTAIASFRKNGALA